MKTGKTLTTLAIALGLLAATGMAATAHQHGAHDASAAGLPEICTKEAAAMGHGAMAMPSMDSMMPSDAHRDLMAGMDAMNSEMMLGGMASDIDVAFVCSMIPHHRGAIDMAEALLEHGDDAWTRSLAEAIILAQEKEIADMLAWLERQPG